MFKLLSLFNLLTNFSNFLNKKRFFIEKHKMLLLNNEINGIISIIINLKNKFINLFFKLIIQPIGIPFLIFSNILDFFNLMIEFIFFLQINLSTKEFKDKNSKFLEFKINISFFKLGMLDNEKLNLLIISTATCLL